MKHMIITVLLLVLLVALLAAPAGAADAPDLALYMEQARASGMSEMAMSTMVGASGILLGQSSLNFQESEPGGRWWPSYSSNSCPMPGLTPDQERDRQEKLRQEREPIMETLRAVADADQSGFVSSLEAAAFRSTFEFWILATQVADKRPGDELALMRAAGVDSAGARAKLASVTRMVDQASARGLDLAAKLGLK